MSKAKKQKQPSQKKQRDLEAPAQVRGGTEVATHGGDPLLKHGDEAGTLKRSETLK